MSDTGIVQLSDVWDQIWERAQQRRRAQEAWEVSPDRWEFAGHPTWAELVTREPRLVALVGSARRAGARADDYIAWYREVKPRVERLVGHLADGQPPPLQTSAAYDVAYQHLLRVYETGSEPQ